MAANGVINLSYGVVEVNGQQVAAYPASVLRPAGPVGPTWMGSGQAPQSIPAGVGAGGSSGTNPTTGLPLLGGFSLSGRTGLVLAGMFLIGYLGLRYIHWAD